MISSSETSEDSTAQRMASPLFMALWLALAPAIATGFGRFAYALVLPAMRADLHWTYAQAGALNTANAVGYLVGAMFTAPLTRIFPARNVMLGGLGVSVAALAFAGLTHSFPLLLACRALVGVSAAFAFIAASGLAAFLGRDAAENALAMGFAMSGPGLGVILTGLIVPFLVAEDVSHWPRAWLTMALIGVVSFFGVWLNTRHLELGTVDKKKAADAKPANLRTLRPALIAYFLFGLGYISYMTFLVAYVRSLGTSPTTVAVVWAGLGLAMVGSTFIWRGAFERERGGRTLALMGFGSSFSAILPLISDAVPALIISAAVFGLTAMPIFTALSVLIRVHLPPVAWTNTIALATVIFAVGQSIGPLGSGWCSDHFGPKASLLWTFAIMMLSSFIALRQQPPVMEAAVVQ